MPVMEGKAMLFKQLRRRRRLPDLPRHARTSTRSSSSSQPVAPTFGGINLEDIAAPRCFEIEERLEELLDIPVFHDDQHGTAVVVLAALLNALQVVGKQPEDVQRRRGRRRARPALAVREDHPRARASRTSIVCDLKGIRAPGSRRIWTASQAAMAARTNKRGLHGHRRRRARRARTWSSACPRPALSAAEDGRARWRRDPIVFAMANPDARGAARGVLQEHVAIMATGRSDYPNQINNVLAFPGIFRGALDVRATGDRRGDEARPPRGRSRA